MNKLIVTLLLFIRFSASAQQPAAKATPKPVLPPGPLLNPAADMSQWTVTFKSVGAMPAANPKSAQQAKPAASDFQMVITKTKPIYHIQIATGAGTRVDKWCLENVQITTVPNAAAPVLSTPENKDAYYVDYSKTDFSGFEWISPNNFTEIKSVSGSDCLIFKDRIKSPLGGGTLGEANEARGPEIFDVQAVIDLKSRLPLFLQVGEALTTFQYGAPPSIMLVPPANVVTLIEQWRARLRQASLVPPA